MYSPTGNGPINPLRSSYQTSGMHGSPVQIPFMNFNTSLNLEANKSAQQSQDTASTPSQYKNLSMSVQQFERKMDNLYPGYKKE
jgi:hypothetical protein